MSCTVGELKEMLEEYDDDRKIVGVTEFDQIVETKHTGTLKLEPNWE